MHFGNDIIKVDILGSSTKDNVDKVVYRDSHYFEASILMNHICISIIDFVTQENVGFILAELYHCNILKIFIKSWTFLIDLLDPLQKKDSINKNCVWYNKYSFIYDIEWKGYVLSYNLVYQTNNPSYIYISTQL